MSRSSVKSLNHSFLSRPRVCRSRQADRAGFTLIEVMIAVTVTLLMMLGLAQMFKVLGDSMNKGRAGLELNNRLRGVLHRVRTDLDNVTAQARPPITVGSGQGYLKYYEGPASDYTFANNSLLNRFGDVDDIFMATVKAKDTWFTGKVPRFIAFRKDIENLGLVPDDLLPETIASQFAEVIIFAQPEYSPDGELRRFRLHYRTLLIRPDLNLSDGNLPSRIADNVMVAGPGALDMADIYQSCDLSMRRSAHPPLNTNVGKLSANTLEDLANPANRFAHSMIQVANGIWSMPFIALGGDVTLGSEPPTLFPPNTQFLNSAFVLSGDRLGEDVLATDLLAFDIRAYDSSAPVLQYDPNPGAPNPESRIIAIRPGDPGFLTVGLPGLLNNQSSVAAFGEFVDLNWAGKFYLTPSQRSIINPLLANNSFNRNLVQTELSGRQADGSIANSLLRSGLVLPLNLSLNTFRIFQPSYDSFTDLYERDGILQAELASTRGMVSFAGVPAASTLLDQWRATQIDGGTDGIDNNASVSPGIDDSSELETSPPFPVHLRGLQISIRLEDGSKKQFKQMSTVKEFVTN